MRTLRASNHIATGGLSTVMNPPGSKALKKKFFQLSLMAREPAE